MYTIDPTALDLESKVNLLDFQVRQEIRNLPYKSAQALEARFHRFHRVHAETGVWDNCPLYERDRFDRLVSAYERAERNLHRHDERSSSRVLTHR